MYFRFTEFSEVDIPALCVAPPLCGRHSYVEVKGSWPRLHKNLSGVGRWNRANFAITAFYEVGAGRLYGAQGSFLTGIGGSARRSASNTAKGVVSLVAGSTDGRRLPPSRCL